MRNIQAYFKTENDAESVRASLESIHVENESVERIPTDHHELIEIIIDIFKPESREDEFSPYLVQFDVSETDFEEASNIVKNNRGYIGAK
ncbi:hypothetical protein [Aquibacillus saliphilus]|uniref:hypothetical protein n=1 Tax=Aquibacillus saliphilus TaxID=1909422 RepID=UPI001CF06C8C|nr:hypothetical protein [Aquibacillus saliphilus]